MAGGSRIVINDQGVTISTGGKVIFKASQHNFESGESVPTPKVSLPVVGDSNHYTLRYLLQDADKHIYANEKYIAFMPNGEVIEGYTDSKGYTEVFNSVQSEKIQIHLAKHQQLDIH